MKKYVFAFLIIMLSLPVQAETKNINQLLYDYAPPETQARMRADAVQVKLDKQRQAEKSAEAKRIAEAQYIESKIKYCDSMARAWNEAEGKPGKSPEVYYDYEKRECIMPHVTVGPEIIEVVPLSGSWRY